ncbi:MAG: WbqC family protein [Bacteroidales bacterium]|jgi:hypothetical protein|nr:WbqC family protein [Bacteroidales bacterium]
MSNQSKKILIPSLLAPPAKLFALIHSCDEVIIDIHETYPKQTLRNHYHIGGPNDVRPLVVPVHKPKGHRSTTYEVEIDYSENWPLYHKKTLTTAYSKSPFFLFYADAIFAEFEKKHQFLNDLNSALRSIFWKWLFIDTPISMADGFGGYNGCTDLRHAFKKSTEWTLQHPYYQPFDAKYGFRNSLSVLDIIFNLGPETPEFLKTENTDEYFQSF